MGSHTVGRHVVEVGLSDESTAYALSREIEAWVEREWLGELEGVLDEHDREGVVFEIDRIELGPYVLAAGDWRVDLRRQLRRDLGDRLASLLDRSGGPSEVGASVEDSVATARPPSPADDARNPAHTLRSETEWEESLWLAFLLDGVLPPVISPAEWTAIQARLAERLERLGGPTAPIAGRLLASGRSASFERLLQWIDGSAILTRCIAAARERFPRTILATCREALAAAPPAVADVVLAGLPWLMELAAARHADAVDAARRIAREHPARHAPVDGTPIDDPADPRHDMPRADPRENTSDDAPAPTSRADPPHQVDEGAVFYTRSAGAVLLHPYLGNLFRRLELLDDGGFVDREARAEAAACVAWAVWSEDAPDEPFLVLEKVLCGVEMFERVPAAPSLRCRREVDLVVEELLHDWPALGNTSVAGVRESFLRRNGRLEWRRGAWRLRVEREAIDVLLERLTFGIGVIRQPWMPGRLEVEWA